ncbi:glycosyltransferase family 2 protein [Paenibacillus sp. HB172176]|uniref:glycosyltransferase family 2 protein n=1 Tax=Paenibacillus sp. HB172176 TaxID=2493690 RepID=UPI0014392182|nr:glycosyltransferase family 2 protein [Paenibacillus sp. HB172176]
MSQVAIIVPIYNAGEKLHTCIASIRGQTFADWTLILVNDGSTDHSLEVARSYELLDARIQLVSQDNKGSIGARMRGLALASSPYVMFVDADDWLERSAVETLLRAALSRNADIAVGRSYRVWSDAALLRSSRKSHYFREERLYHNDEVRKQLVPAFLHGHPFPASLHGKLYRKELLEGSGSFLQHIVFFGDDLYFNLELFLKAGRVMVIPAALYYYRAGGMTSRYMPNLFQDMINGYRIQKEVIGRYYESERELHDAGIAVMLLNTLRTCLKNILLSDLGRAELLERISAYCRHAEVLESAYHPSALRHCSPRFVQAVRTGDAAYLYKSGKFGVRIGLPRSMLLGAIGKFPGAWLNRQI